MRRSRASDTTESFLSDSLSTSGWATDSCLSPRPTANTNKKSYRVPLEESRSRSRSSEKRSTRVVPGERTKEAYNSHNEARVQYSSESPLASSLASSSQEYRSQEPSGSVSQHNHLEQDKSSTESVKSTEAYMQSLSPLNRFGLGRSPVSSSRLHLASVSMASSLSSVVGNKRWIACALILAWSHSGVTTGTDQFFSSLEPANDVAMTCVTTLQVHRDVESAGRSVGSLLGEVEVWASSLII